MILDFHVYPNLLYFAWLIRTFQTVQKLYIYITSIDPNKDFQFHHTFEDVIISTFEI